MPARRFGSRGLVRLLRPIWSRQSHQMLLSRGEPVSAYRRHSLIRLLLACTAICIASGVVAGQASAKAPPCADLYVEDVHVSPTNPVQGMPATVIVTVHNGGSCA